MMKPDIPALQPEHYTHELHELPDGRRLAVSRFGSPGGAPVYYFHGCPGSRIEAYPAHDAAANTGMEVFSFDRPGCGRSTGASGYSMKDWVTDVVHFADSMRHAEFGIIGFSGGGAYVDTCAHSIPGRIRFAYDLGGWAPVHAVPELQASLAPLDRFFLRLSAGAEFLFRWPFRMIGAAARRRDDHSFVRALRSSIGDADRELLDSCANVRTLLRETVKESFAQGNRGPGDDALRCYGDWGFDLADITYPIQLWHGGDDRFASVRFAKYKHKHITNSEIRVFPEFGHLHMPMLFDEVLADAP